MVEQRWQVIVGACQTHGGEGIRVYGVAVKCGDGTRRAWTDVADSYEAAQRLAQRLQQAQAEPCHWDEIVEDYTVALYL